MVAFHETPQKGAKVGNRRPRQVRIRKKGLLIAAQVSTPWTKAVKSQIWAVLQQINSAQARIYTIGFMEGVADFMEDATERTRRQIV